MASLKMFKYALNGLLDILKNEKNMKIHFLAFVIVIICGIYFKIKGFEWVLILFSVSLVFITEIINTALERIVNIISPDFNKSAGQIKDLSAASVLIAAITSVIIGAIVFIPYLKNL